MRLLRYVFLQYLAFCRLRVAEIHHFVEELVDDDEVVADGFFFERLEILCEDLDDLVKEEEDLGGIGVAFCEREEVEVVVPDIEILQPRQRLSAGPFFFP